MPDIDYIRAEIQHLRNQVAKQRKEICNISFQPALLRAGMMNFVQMSRSVRFRLSI